MMSVVTTDSALDRITPPAPIDVDLLFLVNQAAFALTAEMTTALAGVGISPREFCVLSHGMKGDLTQIQLAELSALDKTTMVSTLDKLERAGLAERRLSSTDRRARIVVVTASGRRAVSKAQRIVAGMYSKVLAVLPESDREVFLRSLITVVGTSLATPSHVDRTARRGGCSG
jgi:MarR family transcriptional regulator, transcriptional regulator for hemolysin